MSQEDEQRITVGFTVYWMGIPVTNKWFNCVRLREETMPGHKMLRQARYSLAEQFLSSANIIHQSTLVWECKEGSSWCYKRNFFHYFDCLSNTLEYISLNEKNFTDNLGSCQLA